MHKESSFRDTIWFHSLFHFLYPYLSEKQYISGSGNKLAFAEAVRFFSEQNPFFQKFSLPSDEDEKLKIAEVIIEHSSRLSVMGSNFSPKSSFEPLQSVFSQLFDQKEEKTYTSKLKPLNLADIMPTDKNETFHFSSHFSLFLKELRLINENEQLLPLLEKYFWCVSGRSSKDISLFDEMKTTAAIAVSLYDEYLLEKDTIENFFENQEKYRFSLIHGDVSGIQKFIFNIPSKGAAKSLKGRSVYIGLLSDLIVQSILDQLDLYSSNLLYNGGGNFFILAPRSKMEAFEKQRTAILEHVLKAHAGEIYFAMDALPINLSDFDHFADKWDEIKNKVNRLKKRKWSELNIEEHFHTIFGPVDEGAEENQICKVCGSFGSKQPLKDKDYEIEDEKVQICTLCLSFIELTNQMKKAEFMLINKVPAPKNIRYETYEDIFAQLGYSIKFFSSMPSSRNGGKLYTINGTSFLEKLCSGYRFGAYELPSGKKGQITFKELAERCVKNERGDKKLAHLKLDVDNLGSLFGVGLGNNRSIARVSVLSRMLSLYFGGYLNHLIYKKGWQEHLYVVFSGGDDTYLIGTWKEVFEFAKEFYNDFRTFTCHNPYVTFSAGIRVFHYTYPIIRAADLTEDSLEDAKKQGKQIRHDLPPIKNQVSFLGETFNWEEFNKIEELENILEQMVLEYDNRNVLQKVKRTTIGFKKILKDSTKGNFRNIKFWRLAYYLRDIHHEAQKAAKKGQTKTDYAEILIEKYREIVLHNLFHAKDRDQIKQIMIIPAAVKWAEMATRKVSLKEDEQ